MRLLLLTLKEFDLLERKFAASDLAKLIELRTPYQLVFSNTGRQPLVYSSDSPDKVLAAQRKYGREEVASALDGLFAQIAFELVRRGVTRLVVAGGETSGAVASALNLREVTIGPEIDPGVPVLFTRNGPRIALALKSGNFGSPGFFSEALSMLQTGYR